MERQKANAQPMRLGKHGVPFPARTQTSRMEDIRIAASQPRKQ